MRKHERQIAFPDTEEVTGSNPVRRWRRACRCVRQGGLRLSACRTWRFHSVDEIGSSGRYCPASVEAIILAGDVDAGDVIVLPVSGSWFWSSESGLDKAGSSSRWCRSMMTGPERNGW